MFVCLRRRNSLKLLLWFLFQHLQALTLTEILSPPLRLFLHLTGNGVQIIAALGMTGPDTTLPCLGRMESGVRLCPVPITQTRLF
jgi:hypothetical protein